MKHFFPLLLSLPLLITSEPCSLTPSVSTLQSYLPSSPKLKSGEPLCAGTYGNTRDAVGSFRREEREGTEGITFDVTIVSSSCSRISTASTEIWHATPSGSYSPLTGEDIDCRGTYDGGSFSVNTLLPGSYGLLCGLGPGGVDFPPYGPKTFHFRVSAPGYKTLVTEVEVDGEGWIDWRGPSLVLGGKETTPLNSNIKLVLEPSAPEHEIEDETSCSYLSLLNPYTFFTEPLAGCSGWAVFKFFDM
ncbi:hypothetical protein TrLO_g9122 [Triparma laevis f. longispina]|uniref:Uncharacterized protein n=1 Tax=Triparma laevis f. longispina TaxID=1714387 RepID=A0A9W6ZXW7_9STRA|nr:hypothetical protein TrLO_g9122 [Triparma laevis f. longispina]